MNEQNPVKRTIISTSLAIMFSIIAWSIHANQNSEKLDVKQLEAKVYTPEQILMAK